MINGGLVNMDALIASERRSRTADIDTRVMYARVAVVAALRSLDSYPGEQETAVTDGGEAGAARVLAWALGEKQAATAVQPLRDLLAAYRDLALATSGA